MKAFSSVSVPQNQNSFDNEVKYWKEVAYFDRKTFTSHPHQFHFTLISGVVPVRTTQCETINGKTFPMTSPAWNPQEEVFDGVDPIRDYNETEGGFSACILVLVHEWITNPELNPKPHLGPIAVFEMTKGIFEGILGVQNAWGLENITESTNWPLIALSCSAAHKGGNVNSPLEYTVQGVPPKFAITKEYVDSIVAAGQATRWDLLKFVESKSMAAGELLIFLARNEYYTEPEIAQYALKFLAMGQRYRFVQTEAEVPKKPDDVEEVLWDKWSSWEKTQATIKAIFAKKATSQGIPQPNGMLGNQPPLPGASAPAQGAQLAPPPAIGGGAALAPPPAAGAPVSAPAALAPPPVAGAISAPPAVGAPGAVVAPPAAAAPAAAVVAPAAAEAPPAAVAVATATDLPAPGPGAAATAPVVAPTPAPVVAAAAPLPGAPGAPLLPPGPVAAPQS